MRQLTIRQIVKKLPFDFSKHCTRDISLLSCSIFGESHIIAKGKFGTDFSATFWIVRDNLVNFYRSEREYFEFSRKVGKLCRNINYSKRLAKKLMEMTDWFDDFLKQNETPEDLVKNNKIFFDNYRDFFIYHQAIYWGGDYLSRLSLNKKERRKVDLIVKNLGSAYKYNELTVPKIERCFRKFKINHLLYDELNINVYKNIKAKSKNRGLLFIDKKRIIYSYNKARQLEKLIEKIFKKDYKKLKEFKGLAVGGGIFKGRVRRILNLNKLNKCQRNDVLVTTMTRPQFNKYIKKVAAIITDEGGILCHASILAREFNIPCVIGTKIATKVLKDGDLVEVDANKGIVRKIK